jgi:hypothetical protein
MERRLIVSLVSLSQLIWFSSSGCRVVLAGADFVFNAVAVFAVLTVAVSLTGAGFALRSSFCFCGSLALLLFEVGAH